MEIWPKSVGSAGGRGEKVVRGGQWLVEMRSKLMSLQEFQLAQSLCAAIGVKEPTRPACEASFPCAFLDQCFLLS